MDIDELVGRQVGVLQSGGLSSLALGIWLRERGVPATHYIADLGQSSGADLTALAHSLRAADMPVTMVDLRAQMASVAGELLRYQARHDGGYWNTTGAARWVLTKELCTRLVADNCQVLAHGSVGGGNDQRRFARYTASLAPALDVYPPWTDPAALVRFPDRAAMLAAAGEHGIKPDIASSAECSVDANLAGCSHESVHLEDLRTPATVMQPRWGRWPAEAPEDPEEVTVKIVGGQIVDVGGSGPQPLAWMSRANEIGARHGVWLRDVVERRIIGTVCRGVYESPGLELLDHAWTRALQACLDQHARASYQQLSPVVGEAMYEGRYLAPAARAARETIDVLLTEVTATVALRAHRGVVTVTGMETPGGALRQTRFGSGGLVWSQVA